MIIYMDHSNLPSLPSLRLQMTDELLAQRRARECNGEQDKSLLPDTFHLRGRSFHRSDRSALLEVFLWPLHIGLA